MKYYLNKIVVVEGKEDASYLSSFIEAEYITTDGYNIPKEEIDYINHAYKFKEILVLVDPDKAGRDIEEKLKKVIVKATYLNVDITKCIRGKKTGVAECDQEEIIKILKSHFSSKKEEKKAVLQGKLSKIDLNDKELRQLICDKYHLGKCNLKKMLQRLETLEIKEEELIKTVKEFYGN